MGYFDALAGSCFKETKSGKLAFYPWGKFGKGYEIDSEARHHEIKQGIIRYYMAAIAIGAAAGVALQWQGLIVIPILVFPYLFMLRKWTRGLQTTDEKLTFKESYEAQAKHHHPATLWAMLVGSLLFALGSALALGSAEHFLFGLVGLALFGACSVIFAWMLIARRRLMKQADMDQARTFD